MTGDYVLLCTWGMGKGQGEGGADISQPRRVLQAATWGSAIRAQPPASLQALCWMYVCSHVQLIRNQNLGSSKVCNLKQEGETGKQRGSWWRREQSNFSFEF